MGLLLKIAIFAVVVYTAWTTVRRWFGVLGGGQGNGPPKPPPPAQRQAPPEAARPPVIEETHLCPVCATYVPVAAAKCGRPGCPQPA